MKRTLHNQLVARAMAEIPNLPRGYLSPSKGWAPCKLRGHITGKAGLLGRDGEMTLARYYTDDYGDFLEIVSWERGTLASIPQ